MSDASFGFISGNHDSDRHAPVPSWMRPLTLQISGIATLHTPRPATTHAPSLGLVSLGPQHHGPGSAVRESPTVVCCRAPQESFVIIEDLQSYCPIGGLHWVRLPRSHRDWQRQYTWPIPPPSTP